MALDARFRELVSGRSTGPIAGVLRGALALLEGPYGWYVRRRNRQFDQGAIESRQVATTVISVGNLTVGGTGKTPFVAWLAQWFRDRDIAVTLISRGYGAQNGRPNDEALELSARLPEIPHLQNRDRVAAAHEALQSNPRQVLILDDAFQHRRLARDLDIVLLDALEPFGYEHLLPRGLLREPIAGLARAQVVALSRSDAITSESRREIEARVKAIAPAAIWLELTHKPTRLISSAGETLEFAAAQKSPIAAFCGIGNPAGFRHSLATCGLHAEALLEFPDHCGYSARELSQLTGWLEPLNVEHVVCTRKDLVKIPHEQLAGKHLWALDIELEVLRGKDELEKMLGQVLPTDMRGKHRN